MRPLIVITIQYKMEFITKEFEKNEWKQTEKNQKQYIFLKDDMEFAITKKMDKIIVSSPLLSNGEVYNYVTSFDNDDFDNINSYISEKIHYLKK